MPTTPDVVTPLYGHVSAETAYHQDDYPYGRRLRCERRVWIERHPRLGSRQVTQTTNPKVAAAVWNKPHRSTYASITGALYLDSAEHVGFYTVHEFSDADDVLWFLVTFPKHDDVERLRRFIRFHLAWTALRAEGQSGLAMNGVPVAMRPDEVEEAKCRLVVWRQAAEALRANVDRAREEAATAVAMLLGPAEQ